jgi:hypothetical protein
MGCPSRHQTDCQVGVAAGVADSPLDLAERDRPNRRAGLVFGKLAEPLQDQNLVRGRVGRLVEQTGQALAESDDESGVRLAGEPGGSDKLAVEPGGVGGPGVRRRGGNDVSRGVSLRIQAER